MQLIQNLIKKCSFSKKRLPYSLDQTPQLLFISLAECVRHLLIPVAAREAILREMVD